VEGPDKSITKAKDGYGKRRGIGDTPVARPDHVRKSWKSMIWFTRITMGSVFWIRAFMGPVVVGQDMKRGWSVKPSLAPRKVEGLGSIAKAWDWEGNGFRSREPHNSMEHLQRICVSKPTSQPEDLERHLVHSEDNHGSRVLDPRVSLKDIDEEYTTINVVTVRQRKEERGRRLKKGDIEEVLRSEYLPEAVGSSVFDTAIRVPVDTAPGEMDGEALGEGNRVPIAPENGEEPVVAAFRIRTSTRRTLITTRTRR
jgi:hypothetical protein